MARRRREDEKRPELPFEVPDFNENEYIRRETISFRTTLILFIYSIATAAASFGVWIATGASGRGWFAALLVGGVLGYLLKYIYPALRVDIAHFGRKEWTGTGFLYFFSWLAFFVFFTNPPIYDGVDPDLGIHITPDLQSSGQPVNITVFATDNAGIDADSLAFTIKGPDGSPIADQDALWRHPGRGGWSWQFTPDQDGEYEVTASIADEGGRETDTKSTLRVGREPLDVDRDDNGVFSRPTDRVIVAVRDRPAGLAIWQVRLVPTTAGTGPIVLAHDVQKDLWIAEATHAGFKAAATTSPGANVTFPVNVTFRVEAIEHDSYLLARDHGLLPITAPLTSDRTYTVTFEDDSVLGDTVTKAPKKIPPVSRRTPDVGAAPLVAGLVALVAMAASRRPR